MASMKEICDEVNRTKKKTLMLSVLHPQPRTGHKVFESNLLYLFGLSLGFGSGLGLSRRKTKELLDAAVIWFHRI